ncbi:MAG: hypothetical protein JKY30_00225 [Flavobacteriales bacterium]|nr:hypothetical protein [Flavobacteriales bacterium]
MIQIIVPTIIVGAILKGIIFYNASDEYQYYWNYEIENKKGYVSQRMETDNKIRGLSLYQLGRLKNLQLEEVIKSNVEWLAVHPYFYQSNETSLDISNPKRIRYGAQKDSVLINEIIKAKYKGFSVMLKPHLWLQEGWRSNIHFETKEEWGKWFIEYKKQMLYYAILAEETNIELLCIGTELRSSIENLPEEWLLFIREIKKVYSGKLTYAANWNDPIFEMNTQFWQELDFIGIQGYFPLTTTINPQLEEIIKGWEKPLKTLERITSKFNRPILFTEIGYRADSKATVKPWEWYSIWSPLTTKVSTESQVLAYEAFFQSIWDKKWFAGSFIWQWNSFDFGIRGKPAQNIITKWYN